MITTHQYLDLYPISPDSKKLIVGTIHPHDHENFEIPFFYGNRSSLWKILSEAFPKELHSPITLNVILDFLNSRKIAISDTIRECKRINPTALDKDLGPLLLNKQIVEQIKVSNINEILFTSGFQKNNAFKLFYVDILGHRITEEIRKNRKVIMNNDDFGRPVTLRVLYSPSGSSNVGLSKSRLYLETKSKYMDSHRPVYDFKIDYYKQMFR